MQCSKYMLKICDKWVCFTATGAWISSVIFTEKWNLFFFFQWKPETQVQCTFVYAPVWRKSLENPYNHPTVSGDHRWEPGLLDREKFGEKQENDDKITVREWVCIYIDIETNPIAVVRYMYTHIHTCNWRVCDLAVKCELFITVLQLG